jgi:hypothetical protein
MIIPYDCIPCVVSSIIHVSRLATEDEELRRLIITRALNNLNDLDHTLTPPEHAGRLNKVIYDILGVVDIYREVKDRSTEVAHALLPEIRRILADRGGSFEALTRLVIAGNIIDVGADPHFRLEGVRGRILEVFDMALDLEAVAALEEAMDNAKSIFYIADNCGEAVFDRLLIECYRDKITLGVRGLPVLNDVTRREAEMSGLDIVPIIDTGDCAPGVSLRYSAPEFLEALRGADLVISKGQGNFESLCGEDLPVFFLLRVKCAVISTMLGQAELGSLQVINHAQRRTKHDARKRECRAGVYAG